MTLHVRQADRTRTRPTQWTPWGAMPATREPHTNRKRADMAAARQQPRLVASGSERPIRNDTSN